MKESTLIRFTSKKYADSYRSGDLYLSSLSSFWNIAEGRIRQEDIAAGKLTEDEIEKAQEWQKNSRQDFSEGVIAQFPRDKLPKELLGELADHVIHDIRFRLAACRYCNLLCFFRIDAADDDRGMLDEDNVALLLRQRGVSITGDDLRNGEPQRTRHYAESVVEINPLLSENKIHMVQLPAPSMDQFGDVVIVIKDEREFKKRVLAAVKKQGGHVIMGDVRYHPMMDRVDPKILERHHVTLISSTDAGTTDVSSQWLNSDGSFNLSMIETIEDVYWRGVLDKYDIFGVQKEWRVCWLPDEHNYEGKILKVGSLEDIVDVVDTRDIRKYLLQRYRGYIPGFIKESRREIDGTDSYRAFMKMLKGIDGTGELVMEFG